MTPQFLDASVAIDTFVVPGMTLGVGGMHMTSAPMALVGELVRRRVSIGRLVTSPSASLQAELPIAAGLVSEVLSPYVGFEDLGLAPAFRRAVERGSLRVMECDEGSLTHALYAGAGGLGFIPSPPGVADTNIPQVNPDWYQTTTDPFTGDQVVVVPALRPDVVLLACAEADVEGNVAFGRFPFTDRLLALAAYTLVVQVERVVPVEALTSKAPGETIPSFLVAAVVEAPGGCAPTGSPGFYDRDVEALRAYLAAAKEPERLTSYIDANWSRAAP